MGLSDQKIIMFATLLERSGLSQQIFAQYLSKFSNYIIQTPIRTSVKGQEALVCGQTILEHAPSTPLAQDYFELINSIWNTICNTSTPSNSRTMLT